MRNLGIELIEHKHSRVQEALDDVPLVGARLSLILLGVTDAFGVNCADHEQRQER